MIKVNSYNKAAPEYLGKKHEVAKKMRPIGEDMHQTFKKLGKAVGKLKHHQKDSGKLAF